MSKYDGLTKEELIKLLEETVKEKEDLKKELDLANLRNRQAAEWINATSNTAMYARRHVERMRNLANHWGALLEKSNIPISESELNELQLLNKEMTHPSLKPLCFMVYKTAVPGIAVVFDENEVKGHVFNGNGVQALYTHEPLFVYRDTKDQSLRVAKTSIPGC